MQCSNNSKKHGKEKAEDPEADRTPRLTLTNVQDEK